MACKEGQFVVVEPVQDFSINLNAQHVNGMTPFDVCTVIRYSRVKTKEGSHFGTK